MTLFRGLEIENIRTGHQKPLADAQIPTKRQTPAVGRRGHADGLPKTSEEHAARVQESIQTWKSFQAWLQSR